MVMSSQTSGSSSWAMRSLGWRSPTRSLSTTPSCPKANLPSFVLAWSIRSRLPRLPARSILAARYGWAKVNERPVAPTSNRSWLTRSKQSSARCTSMAVSKLPAHSFCGSGMTM
ncbi:UNVERIFIED_CONTAM: hypothetical protein GTU68_035566 [Idotea baltica]|nr:hypothetical protein [Idotea baltica]